MVQYFEVFSWIFENNYDDPILEMETPMMKLIKGIGSVSTNLV